MFINELKSVLFLFLFFALFCFVLFVQSSVDEFWTKYEPMGKMKWTEQDIVFVMTARSHNIGGIPWNLRVFRAV